MQELADEYGFTDVEGHVPQDKVTACARACVFDGLVRTDPEH